MATRPYYFLKGSRAKVSSGSLGWISPSNIVYMATGGYAPAIHEALTHSINNYAEAVLKGRKKDLDDRNKKEVEEAAVVKKCGKGVWIKECFFDEGWIRFDFPSDGNLSLECQNIESIRQLRPILKRSISSGTYINVDVRGVSFSGPWEELLKSPGKYRARSFFEWQTRQRESYSGLSIKKIAESLCQKKLA